jgi:PAS domain S-box-containing protein
MNNDGGGLNPELLVATEDQSFGSAVVDAVERTAMAARAEYVEPATDDLTQRATEDFDGAILDGQIAEPAATIEGLTERAEIPVVVLNDPAGDGDTIARVIEAGATDVFPRTTANAQYELAVERLLADSVSTSNRAGELAYGEAYEALFEKISEGLVVHNPETGVIVDVNERFCEMNGYERSELLGESIGTVLTEATAYGPEAAREMIQRARTEGPQRFEWRNQRRDGETFPVEVDLTVIELDGVERVLASVQDITERKRREREYEQIFNEVNDIIAIHDPKTGEMIDVNPRMCELTGYDRETALELGTEGLLGEHPSQDYAPSEAPMIVDRVMGGEEIDPYEQVLETSNGELVWIEVNPTRAVIGGEQRFVAISRDITERKRREREYEQIFNGVDAAITVHDPAAQSMVDINETMAKWTGYDRDELLAGGVELFSATEEGFIPERAYEVIRQVADSGEDRTIEWKIETAEGNYRWLESRATTATIGGEQHVLGISQDITERKRRKREYEQIFNGVNEGITIHDPETGELLDVNDAFCDLLGYDREKIIESEVMEYTPSGQGYTVKKAKEFIREVVETGEPKRTEWAVKTADGEIRQLEVTGTTVEIGGDLRYVAIDRDITERKRREQEFEQIFNGVQDAIAVFDPDTLEYLDANEAYLEMFDHESVSELRERGVSGLSITEEGYTEQRGREVHQRVAETGQPEIVEWQGKTNSGERLWLEVKVAPAVIGGEQRTISIQRDITERKRREQRLEVFNRILRHNLRNQLDVIQSHAEELSDRTSGDHAERIVAAVDELAGIGIRARQIDRILSKDDTLTEIDITQTVRETVEKREPMAKDVSVTTEFPRETRLLTDRETLTMAVESALENALEHAASTVTVTVENEPDRSIIEIVDDGPGIPEEELMPVKAQTETRLQHGRGLGLWQLRWCVDNLNGELSFETQPGTTVRITVPDRRESGRSC